MKKKLWIIYGILILGVLAYILFLMPIKKDENLDKSNISEEQVYGSLEDMFTVFLKGNYEYTYNVLINNEKFLYVGKKDGDKEKGTFTSKDEVVSYNTINEFINKNFINPTYIYNLIKDLEYNKDKYDNIRVFNYETKINDLKTEIAIYTDYTSITKINITNIKEQYSLSFKNVGFTYVDWLFYLKMLGYAITKRVA